MKKGKNYSQTRFGAEVLKEAIAVYDREIKQTKNDTPKLYMSVDVDEATWGHSSEEEFFADYRRGSSDATYIRTLKDCQFRVQVVGTTTVVEVEAERRSQIEAVFEVLEENLQKARLPDLEAESMQKPTIFIGHGRSSLWRDLKDHLQDKHGYQIQAYEVGARAGHVIRDILEELLTKSSFAVLVMTAEDETADGSMRARQNVIHEIGLFQGKLGFSKVIVLLEEGTEEFSNIQGIIQIRFSKGNIKETFGEILATIRREFSST